MEQLPEELKSEIWSNIKVTHVVYLATVEGSHPRLRPVTMGNYENKFWMLTGTKDAKTAQIKSNPNVALLLDLENDKGRGYVLFTGKAKLITDKKIKSRITLKFPFFNDFWQTPEDENCTLIGFDITSLEYLRPGEMLAKAFRI